MSNVVPFPRVDGAAASSSTTLGLSRDDLRQVARTNFYRAERRLGVAPEIAHERADEHARRFDEILDDIRYIMTEVG
jgi:predicted glycosyl hydrolase (DUF1957 family)